MFGEVVFAVYLNLLPIRLLVAFRGDDGRREGALVSLLDFWKILLGIIR